VAPDFENRNDSPQRLQRFSKQDKPVLGAVYGDVISGSSDTIKDHHDHTPDQAQSLAPILGVLLPDDS
jgi:hypothetical protein